MILVRGDSKKLLAGYPMASHTHMLSFPQPPQCFGSTLFFLQKLGRITLQTLQDVAKPFYRFPLFYFLKKCVRVKKKGIFNPKTKILRGSNEWISFNCCIIELY